MNRNAACLLVNYRKIHNDFMMMKPEDEEYEIAKRYIDSMNEYLKSLEHIPLPQTGFLEKSKLTTKQIRLLYLDVLTLSYFSENHRPAEEIAEFLKKKYGLNINPPKLSKIKSYAVDYFALVLPEN